MSEFVVDTEALRAHAGKLDQIAADGADATEAAGQVTCNGDAFGILCSFVGAMLEPVEQSGIAEASAAQRSVTATASNMRGMATAYDTADEKVHELMRKIGEIF